MDSSLKNIRRDFSRGTLDEKDLPESPLELMLAWYQVAVDKGLTDANAMTLSTLDLEGFPVSRIVLLRDATKNGLSFFTNYSSAKGREIAANPKGGLQFYWGALERQVRVRGKLQKVPQNESDVYFASRPRESQIGAWASPQSEVVASREELEMAVASFTEKFMSEPMVPRPPHWGGYCLIPDTFEFWQGRPSRLHDRLRATLKGGQWVWERLAP